MKKTNILTLLSIMVLVLFSFSVLAEGGHDNFEETAKLIESGISCDDITQEQLEEIGDYYMEQMHPGDAHKVMDERMGGEGSETLKQVHINMAYRFYCAQQDPESAYNYGYGMGMMGGTTSGMMGSGILGSGMMGSKGSGCGLVDSKGSGYGMFGSSYANSMHGSYLGKSYSWGWKFIKGIAGLIYVALIAFVFSLVFWWVKGVLSKEKKGKKK